MNAEPSATLMRPAGGDCCPSTCVSAARSNATMPTPYRNPLMQLLGQQDTPFGTLGGQDPALWHARRPIPPGPDPTAVQSAAVLAKDTPVGSVGTVETQFLDLSKPLALDCGRTLHPIRIAYETYGTLSPACDNVILVCHALSGDAHAAGFARKPAAESTRDGFRADERDAGSARGLGWWDGMIGPGKAFDTNRFFVVSSNLLGGCRGTTGPSSTNPATGRPYALNFPVITVGDMVRAEKRVLDELGITRLVAIAGGSLGGMQALEWAILYPEQVEAIVVIASTHALQPQGVAWNAIARSAIMADPAWQGGHYDGTGRKPDGGM